jgi:hypothetical protein
MVIVNPVNRFKEKSIMNFRFFLAVLATVVWFAQLAPAQTVQYSTSLSGAAEDDPNDSPGTGTSLVTIDTAASTMRVQASFSDLMGTVTAAHIHCCTAEPLTGAVSVATQTPTFPNFPSGVTAGTYDMTFDLNQDSSYNSSFLTANGGTASGAKDALLAGLDAGRAYFNIHTTSFGGGEIRGFLVVPEPSSGCLVLIGLGVIALASRKRRLA